ncbi:MAG: tripartite tricarboxylate transporter substrate binding protein [Xanthobacteraceae bacterium]|nr:tripartite tricarboxylate transporter substrate binding protein [Xanthobacteraceae bacterium]
MGRGQYLSGLFGLATVLLVGQAVAQTPDATYPTRPIKIISASPAGGGVDLSARIVAEHLQRLWGQPVTVENRTGGSNNIAGEAVARAEPDGYTLLATPPGTITANAVLFKQLNYDPAALEPVAIMAVGPNVLVVKNSLPIKTVADLIAYAKANPATMSYASQGNGSTSHLTTELFKSRTGIQLVHVPYRGAAPAATDIAGGHVDVMFCDLGTILPLYQAGKVNIIAVSTLTRLSQLPAVPTVDESGIKGFSSTTFFSLMAPPKTSPEIRIKLNRAIVVAMQTPEVRAKLKAIFVEASTLDMVAMGEFVKAEAKLWGDVIRAANITVEQ